jgi:ABC-type nitrate/sulfonate/bicarbonate transport system permease component
MSRTTGPVPLVSANAGTRNPATEPGGLDSRRHGNEPRKPSDVPWMAQTMRYLKARPGLARIGVIVLLLVAWEIAARYAVDKMFLSPPSVVFSSLPSVFQTRGVIDALRVTFFELAVAFVLSVVIGLALGLAVGLHRFSNRSFMPIILLLYGTPQITILPLFILYFGIGPASKIAFGVTHGMFPIIVTVVAGVQNIKPILLTSARSMGASRWQIGRWVIFPHMIPSFFAGMRLGMTGVLLGVLLAELYVSTAGIGYFTSLFTQSFNPTKLLGLVSVLAAMAIGLNEMVRRAEVHFSRWRE